MPLVPAKILFTIPTDLDLPHPFPPCVCCPAPLIMPAAGHGVGRGLPRSLSPQAGDVTAAEQVNCRRLTSGGTGPLGVAALGAANSKST